MFPRNQGRSPAHSFEAGLFVNNPRQDKTPKSSWAARKLLIRSKLSSVSHKIGPYPGRVFWFCFLELCLSLSPLLVLSNSLMSSLA